MKLLKWKPKCKVFNWNSDIKWYKPRINLWNILETIIYHFKKIKCQIFNDRYFLIDNFQKWWYILLFNRRVMVILWKYISRGLLTTDVKLFENKSLKSERFFLILRL